MFKKSGHPTHLPLPDASSKSAQTAPASTRPVAHDRTTSSKRPGQDTGAGAPTSYTSRGAPQLGGCGTDEGAEQSEQVRHGQGVREQQWHRVDRDGSTATRRAARGARAAARHRPAAVAPSADTERIEAGQRQASERERHRQFVVCVQKYKATCESTESTRMLPPPLRQLPSACSIKLSIAARVRAHARARATRGAHTHTRSA